jgi:hypothetical protein
MIRFAGLGERNGRVIISKIIELEEDSEKYSKNLIL